MRKPTVGRPGHNLLVLVVVALFASGCASGDPKAYPVKGKLEINGQPAGGVTLVFTRITPFEKAIVPSALTEADGSFTVTTYVSNDGAPEGEYTVSLFWPEWRKGFKVGPDRLSKDYDKTALWAKIEAKSLNELPPFRITAEVKPASNPRETSEKRDKSNPRRGDR